MALEASGSLLLYGGGALGGGALLRRLTTHGQVLTLAELGPVGGYLGQDAAGKTFFTTHFWVGRIDGLAAPA